MTASKWTRAERWMRRSSPLAAGILAAALMIGARVIVPDPFERLQLYGFDTLQRLMPPPDADSLVPGSGVIVVDIDEASLAQQGQWPWPRSRVAALVRNLQDAGAAAIGLDIVFAEPDRTSPAFLASSWREQGLLVRPAGAGGQALPDYDGELAQAVARGRVVTGFGLLAGPNGRSPALTNAIATIGGDPAATFSGFAGAVPNLRIFDEAAAGQGSFTIAATGRDEIIRRLPLFMALSGKLVPSLTMEVLRVASGDDDGLRLRAERNGVDAPVLGYVARVGSRDVPVAKDGTIWLRHGMRRPEMTVSAARALDPAAATQLRDRVRGRVVLVGTSATGLADLRPTPFTPFEPGVEIHAGAIEQIADGIFLNRPASAPGAEILAAAALATLAAGAVAAFGVRWGAAIGLAGAAALFGGSVLAFSRAGLLLDPSFAVLTLAASCIAAALVRHLLVERDASRLRSAFGQYLSPSLVEALARDPRRLRLGGEEREMSFLFTDLEGFTSFTEAVEPELLVATLNAYLDGVCRIAMEHGGTIDKIVGDAVHVMFNAPVDQPDHAARAVRCALAIDGFARRFAADALRTAPGMQTFGVTRIGVNTGRAVVGNFGGERRFDYTAHGDAINTAARLEAANKHLGTRICVARSSVEAVGTLPDLGFRPAGEIALKGKAQRVEVFAPLSADDAEAAWARRYRDAFARLSRGEESGAQEILALLSLYPEDPLLAFHARRIAAGERSTRVAAQVA